ncbi:MAG: hypothetical protein IKC11_04510 [Clostridia bacterium]|nr:hypothetical protein [Clostridia bacterium]
MTKKKKISLSIVFSILFVCLSFCCVSFLNFGNKDCAYALNNGGVIYLTSGAKCVKNQGSIKNKKGDKGGAIYVGNGATFTMNGGSISGCSATYGGAIYVASGGLCYLNKGTISNCSASAGGNAIYVEEGGYLEMAEGFIIEGSGDNYTGSIKAINPLNVKRPVTITPYVNSTAQTAIKTFSNVKLSDAGLPTPDGCGWYEESAYTNQVSTSNLVSTYAETDTLNLYFPNHNWETTEMYYGDTCQEEGGSERECLRCSVTESLDYGGYYGDHIYECIDSSVGSNCQDEGFDLYECSVCLDWYEEPNGQYGDHEYECVDGYRGEDCLTEGEDYYECILCADRYSEPNGSYGDHDYCSQGLTGGNCEIELYEVFECSVCADVYEEPTGQYGDHDYECVGSSAGSDCESEGIDIWECTVCYDWYEEFNGLYGEHNYECIDSSIGSNCQDEGFDLYECSVCLDWYEEPNGLYGLHEFEINALGGETCIYCGLSSAFAPTTGGVDTEVDDSNQDIILDKKTLAYIKKDYVFDIKAWLDKKE